MIIITGGDGFIGKKLVPLVRKKYPKEKIFLVREREIDLVTQRGVEKIPKNPRLIFHLAAATDTSKSDQRCNDLGTLNLLRHVGKIGQKTHIIFTSSQAIFSGRINTTKPIGQNTKPMPNNRYGKTKLDAEKILKKASKKDGFRLSIVRLPTVWGKNPRKNSFLNFLTKFVDQNSFFSKLNWPGKIALISVDDAAKYILNLAEKPAKIVSVAVENLTLAEIFEKICISRDKNYRQINLPRFVWNIACALRPYLKLFERMLPTAIYNYFWRGSIVVDSPLECKVNTPGEKFTS